MSVPKHIAVSTRYFIVTEILSHLSLPSLLTQSSSKIKEIEIIDERMS